MKISETHQLYGFQTVPKDRHPYQDPDGLSFIMSSDMIEAFRDYTAQIGKEIYGKISVDQYDFTELRARVARLCGERTTGILISVAEFAHNNDADAIIDPYSPE